MATLHLRNVPPDLDAALTAAASAAGTSKNRRAIEALRRGLGLDQAERVELVERIRRNRRPIDVDVAGSSARAGLTSTSDRGLIVLDASVLVELVADGRHARAADAVIARYATRERLTFVSAAHCLVEATNALRKLAFRGQLTAQDGLSAVQALGELDIALDATAARLPRIWSLRDRMSAYDAAYAATADALQSPLVTVDKRLLRACRDAGIAAMDLDELATAS